jgi:hypothetical protein
MSTQHTLGHRERVVLSIAPRREYEVEFDDAGAVRVWSLFDRKPVTKRGHYQADNGARLLNRNGPTAIRAIAVAGDQIDARAAIARAEGRHP